jgi:hypothetical protein
MRKGRRKQFFSEEKNQKTFISCGQQTLLMGASGAAAKEQKFFGAFFQKRTASFALTFLCGPHASFWFDE